MLSKAVALKWQNYNERKFWWVPEIAKEIQQKYYTCFCFVFFLPTEVYQSKSAGMQEEVRRQLKAAPQRKLHPEETYGWDMTYAYSVWGLRCWKDYI